MGSFVEVIEDWLSLGGFCSTYAHLALFLGCYFLPGLGLRELLVKIYIFVKNFSPSDGPVNKK